MDLKNKNVIITGASGGIGKELISIFIKEKANLILVARDEEKLKNLSNSIEKKYNIKLDYYSADLSSEDAVSELITNIVQKHENIDVLINNAGVAIYDSVEEADINDLKRMMDVNFWGMVFCIKNILPLMLKKNFGHIVNIASVAGVRGFKNTSGYSASKFAIVGFSESLFKELEDTNVNLSVVCPGTVETEMLDGLKSKMDLETMGVKPLKPIVVAQKTIEIIKKNKKIFIFPFIIPILMNFEKIFPKIAKKIVLKVAQYNKKHFN